MVRADGKGIPVEGPLTAALDVDAVLFDAYGTLFDVASAAQRNSARLGERWPAFAELWRRKQLEYTWLRSLTGHYVDFWHVTGESLDYAMRSFRLDNPGLRAALMEQYLNLDAYADVPEALARLRGAGKRTALLSNGSPSMLIAATNGARLSGLLDPPISVDAVQVFKPHPRVYQLAVDRLATPAERICFVSANGWDAWCGAAFGLRAVWVNRGGAPTEGLPGAPTAIVSGVGDVPTLLGL
ncbi:MAG: haloacid dehalogenase type II [Alphaproteobacteria bacterium]|nr:haloacid dehalogenase type II [Alphaproteobacteria bacterium]